MSQSLQLEQHQGVYVTAQMLQGISMVGMSAQELVEYVHDNIDRNPFLEEATPLTQEYLPELEPELEPSQITRAQQYDCRPSADELGQKLTGCGQLFGDGSYEKTKRDYSFEQFLTQQPTLEEYLLSQVDLQLRSQKEIIIAQYLIGNLDSNGYLRISTAEVANSLKAPLPQVDWVLGVLQSCSPAGIGARNLKEYLLLQLKATGKATPLAVKVISGFLEDLARGKQKQIARHFKVPVANIQQIYDQIRTLRAHASLPFDNLRNFDIWPEVLVVKQGNGFVVSMQDVYLPELTINQEYVALASKPGIDPKTTKYLRTEHKSAETLIEGIKQRRQSIFKVASCIVGRQSEFMEKGIDFLLPMTMAEVASAVNLSESTVSRVANGNYMQTPQGIFELRYFFSSGVINQSGKNISPKSIKHTIQGLVASENPARPLSDTEIQAALAKDGIAISRRTVNKYRTSMGIPTNTQRRRFS